MNMKRMGFIQKHTYKFQNPAILAKVKDTYTRERTITHWKVRLAISDRPGSS